jgi:hypothetical protein
LIELHTIKPLNNKDNWMTGIITKLSILTLNVNRLISPIKRHHLANWIKMENPTICCLQETHLNDRNKHCLGWKAGRRFTKTVVSNNRQELQCLSWTK